MKDETAIEWQRIGVFGGSFDPVHSGHLEIVQRAQKRLGLDRVFFVPCRQSPHKSEQTGADGEQRLQMISLAIQAFPWAAGDDWELRQLGENFSWKTAEEFRQRYPAAKLYWIMGEDQWKVLQTWNRIEYFLSLVEVIVHRRGGLGDGEGAIFLEGNHPASASEIRRCLQEENPVPQGWLNPEVARFVKEEGLYLS